MRERAIIAALILLPFSLIAAVVLYSCFSRSPEVTEVRARVLPIGMIGWWSACLTDLDRDGEDEIVIPVAPQGWMNLSERLKWTVIAVSMKDGKFVTNRLPLSISAQHSSFLRAAERGQWFVCVTEKGELAVFERKPDGKWQESSLLTGTAIYDFAVADFDGNKLADDVVAILPGQFLWFQRLPSGQFQKRGETSIPARRHGEVGVSFVSNCAAFLWTWKGKSHLMPVLLWEGKLQVGQLDERVVIFKGDWFGRGQESKMLVRFLKGGEKVHWQVESSNLKGALSFKGWRLARAGATNKFGDGKWHLLVTMAKPNPLTVRVVDCAFEPSKGWQVREIGKWEVRKQSSSTRPIFFSEWLEALELTFGDADGDGQDEVVIRAKDEFLDRWLLCRLGHEWKVLTIAGSRKQDEFLPRVMKDGRLWFIRKHRAKNSHFVELGTFDPQGKWRSLGKYKGWWSWQNRLHDLNGDGCPELLAFEGLIWQKPVLYYRSAEGQWRKKSFAGGSWGRLLEVWLRGGFDASPDPMAVHVVRWDGENWFAIVWGDGFVQAVTLNR